MSGKCPICPTVTACFINKPTFWNFLQVPWSQPAFDWDGTCKELKFGFILTTNICDLHPEKKSNGPKSRKPKMST